MPAASESTAFYGGMRGRLGICCLVAGIGLHGPLLWGVSRGTGATAWFGGALAVAGILHLLWMARRRVVVDGQGVEVRVRRTRRITWSDFDGVGLRLVPRGGWVVSFHSRAEQSDHLNLALEDFPVRQLLDAVATAAQLHRPTLSPQVAELASRFPPGRMPSDFERRAGRRALWLGGLVLVVWVVAWLPVVLRL